MITGDEIAKAWLSVDDEWIVRRNKAHTVRQWEVVHRWGPKDIVDDATMKVLRRYALPETATAFATRCEVKARGEAVLNCLRRKGYKV